MFARFSQLLHRHRFASPVTDTHARRSLPSLIGNGLKAISNVSLECEHRADGLCGDGHHNMSRRIPMAVRNSGNPAPPDPRSATCRCDWSTSRLLRIFRCPALARDARSRAPAEPATAVAPGRAPLVPETHRAAAWSPRPPPIFPSTVPRTVRSSCSSEPREFDRPKQETRGRCGVEYAPNPNDLQARNLLICDTMGPNEVWEVWALRDAQNRPASFARLSGSASGLFR